MVPDSLESKYCEYADELECKMVCMHDVPNAGRFEELLQI